MSSLQRALVQNNGQSFVSGRTGISGSSATVDAADHKSSRGHFENCFADGLDLSEFSNAVENTDNAAAGATGHVGTRRTTSASADLLKVKQLERQQKHHDEMEERRLQQSVQRRISNISHSIAEKKVATDTKKKASPSINDVLIMCHGSDSCLDRLTGSRGSHQIAKKQKKQTKNDLKKQQQLRHTFDATTTKARVIKGKSSRQIKY
jgi:hypothetical protein